jgi:hypothetical protein
MKHGRFTEWLYLSVFDELGADEKRRLDEHVASCEECQREREAIVRMLDKVTASGAGEPSDELLASAQQSLRAALWKESLTQAAADRPAERGSIWTRIFGSAGGGWFTGYRPALAAAATLCVGFYMGFLVFDREQPAATVPQPRQDANEPYTEISNVRFVDANIDDGEVDIIYDQVRPMRLQTRVDDQRVQDVLTYAMLNEDNPGVRLKALRAFELAPKAAPPGDMKQAFIEAMTSDPNEGVRLQALQVLRRLPFDDDIKDSLIFVLSNDVNPGIRVAAMNFLAERAMEGAIPEQEMYDILGNKTAADRNAPVRSQPANNTEEVQ